MHSGAEILTKCLLFFFNNPYNCIGDRHNNLTTARDDGNKKQPEIVQAVWWVLFAPESSYGVCELTSCRARTAFFDGIQTEKRAHIFWDFDPIIGGNFFFITD